jgi:hypothetical protein
MPFVKIFERDPMAVFKAFAMTATAALLVEFIPTDVKADLVSWARNAFIKEPPFILPHARVPITLVLVALIAIVVSVEYRQKIWCMLFFKCVPQTRSHHTADVGRHDDQVFVVLLAQVTQQYGRGVNVVDRDVKKALNLVGVQVHGQHTVNTHGLQHVGHHLGRNRHTG